MAARPAPDSRAPPSNPTVAAVASKDKANSAGIDRFTASTPPSRAPYFLVWFFNKLQGELQQIGQELQDERAQRAALRLTIPIALYVAAGAFSYFIFIMFLFLLVSIEASAAASSSICSITSNAPIRS